MFSSPLCTFGIFHPIAFEITMHHMAIFLFLTHLWKCASYTKGIVHYTPIVRCPIHTYGIMHYTLMAMCTIHTYGNVQHLWYCTMVYVRVMFLYFFFIVHMDSELGKLHSPSHSFLTI